MSKPTGWGREFDDPIELPGRTYRLVILKAEQSLLEWQTAIGCLIGAAEGRDFLTHVEREFNPDRKDTHWGERKLKRDQ